MHTVGEIVEMKIEEEETSTTRVASQGNGRRLIGPSGAPVPPQAFVLGRQPTVPRVPKRAEGACLSGWCGL